MSHVSSNAKKSKLKELEEKCLLQFVMDASALSSYYYCFNGSCHLSAGGDKKQKEPWTSSLRLAEPEREDLLLYFTRHISIFACLLKWLSWHGLEKLR